MKVWLFLGILLQTTLASADALSNRLESFSILHESKATFVETWSADYLDEPLVSNGELTYKRPGQLFKIIINPNRIEQQIDGNQLLVIHDGVTRSIQLSEQPVLAAGIHALQAVLDGDEESLHQLFKLQYDELNTGWKLSLTPKDQQVADSLELIILQGKENRLHRMSLEFYNGNSLITEIAHSD